MQLNLNYVSFFLLQFHNQVSHPNRQDILDYKRTKQENELSANTRSIYLVAVRGFFEWMEINRLYPDVCRGIKGAKQARGFRREPLTVDQVKQLLESVGRANLQGYRDYAIINLLVRTCLRTIEVVRADVGDIRQESGEAVLWIQVKGRESKDEFVLLTDNTLRPIREYLGMWGKIEERDRLIASLSDRNLGKSMTIYKISRTVKHYLRNIGLNGKNFTAHSLRHTAIILSLMGGASLQ